MVIEDRLLHVEQVGREYLGLSRTVVYELIGSGRLRSVQIGTSRRVPLSAVQEFIAAEIGRKTEGSAEAAQSRDRVAV